MTTSIAELLNYIQDIVSTEMYECDMEEFHGSNKPVDLDRMNWILDMVEDIRVLMNGTSEITSEDTTLWIDSNKDKILKSIKVA